MVCVSHPRLSIRCPHTFSYPFTHYTHYTFNYGIHAHLASTQRLSLAHPRAVFDGARIIRNEKKDIFSQEVKDLEA